jgi:hypothetical protein
LKTGVGSFELSYWPGGGLMVCGGLLIVDGILFDRVNWKKSGVGELVVILIFAGSGFRIVVNTHCNNFAKADIFNY